MKTRKAMRTWLTDEREVIIRKCLEEFNGHYADAFRAHPAWRIALDFDNTQSRKNTYNTIGRMRKHLRKQGAQAQVEASVPVDEAVERRKEYQRQYRKKRAQLLAQARANHAGTPVKNSSPFPICFCPHCGKDLRPTIAAANLG